MKVKKITVNNLKAISNLTADFNGCTAIITGGNNKGKSSFLRSLPERLQGNKPDIIVKQNEEEGFAEWELTDGSKFIWKFDTKTKKGETLTFITKEGIKATVTKGIAQRYFPPSFDIDAFLVSPPKKQSETLQRLVGLDFTDLDAQYKHAYDERTDLNAIAKSEQAKVVPVNGKLPDTTVDISESHEQIQKAIEHNENVKQIQRNIADGEKTLADKKEQLKTLQNQITTCEKGIATNQAALKDKSLIDITALNVKVEEAITLNDKIKANSVAKQQAESAKDAAQKAEEANKAVLEIQKKKAEKVRSAKVPSGFEFTETGILYNGLPLSKEQQSSSSLYIAALKLASMNLGEVQTLYFDASTLDKNSLAEIEKWANENDLQLLIERPDYDGEEIQYEIHKTPTP